jgi:hypothetical protein
VLRGKRLSVPCVLLFLALLLVSVKPTWANTTVTPNPALANQPITFSDGNSNTHLIIYSGSGCTGTVLDDFSVSEFGYTVTLSAGLPAGSYSATDGTIVPCVNFTVQAAPPIPEYPLGVAILAIFMLVGYGLVRRRTRN